MPNKALERACGQRSRVVLAINCVLGGAESAPCQAAQLDRYTSSRSKWMHRCILCAIALGATGAFGAAVQELDARAEKSLATAEGRAYENVANAAFWRDATFMGECAPVNPKAPDPITIYVEILPDGRMGQFEITPMTSVAKCIVAKPKALTFPKPPSAYVLKLELRFTK
jgi:hypothetical protein